MSERACGQRCAQRVQRGVARARHQLVAGQAAALDRAAVELAHLRGGVERRRGAAACASLYWPPIPAGRTPSSHATPRTLARSIKHWGRELGFQQVGIAGVDLGARRGAARRLARRTAGTATMDYMARHGTRRSRPAELVPGTLRVISARMDYRPTPRDADAVLRRPALGYVSRYALGRDYHKRAAAAPGAARRPHRRRGRRAPATAPSPTAHRCSRRRWRATPGSAGSASTPTCSTGTPARGSSSARSTPTCRCRSTRRRAQHCGTLHRLHRRLPDAGDRRAVRARRAPLHLLPDDRAATARSRRNSAPRIGNRIYGCDDCQLVCPWNRFAQAHRRAGLPRAPRARRAAAWSTCSAGARRNSCAAPKAARSAASATSAGCATSRSRSATRRARRRCSRRCESRAADPSRAGARARAVGACAAHGGLRSARSA